MKPAILEKTKDGYYKMHNFKHIEGSFTLKWGFSQLVFDTSPLNTEKPAACKVTLENGLITDPIIVEIINGFCPGKFTSFIFVNNGQFYVQSPIHIRDDFTPDANENDE